MGYTISYPDIAFAFSPCYLTLTADADAVDQAYLSGYSLSEMRYPSYDKIKFDLRPFILAALSVIDPLQVNYNQDVDTGLFRQITLSLGVEGQGVTAEQESMTINLYAAFGAIGPLDNMSINRKIPYNPNYPFSLDVFSDGQLLEVSGDYNYAFDTGASVKERIWDEGMSLYRLDPDVANIPDLYISASIKVQIAANEPPSFIRVRASGFSNVNIPAKDGVYNINERVINLNNEEYNALWVFTDGDVTVTISNLMLSKRPSTWQPNPIDLSRKINLFERRTASVKGLGFDKILPNPITYWLDECFTGQITNESIANVSDQYITIYPDNRKDGVYLRWLDKFGRVCYRLLQQANKTLQVAANNSFSVEADYSIGYFNAVKGHPGDSEYAINTAQQTLKLGEQMCDKYAIQELMGLAASQFVQMYVNNGGNMWLRVNVVPGSYTLKGSTLQEFSISIKLPKESIQHL